MKGIGPYGLAVDVEFDAEQLREIEALGFGTLWVNGGQIDRLDRLSDVVSATSRAVVASAVVMAGDHQVGDLGAFYQRVEAVNPGRLVMGLGPFAGPQASRRLIDYFERLPIPRSRRLLAAFGPGRLDLARQYCAGAVPMLLTPEHTAVARRRLGAEPVLALGQYAVLDENPARARETARVPLRFLFSMPAYVKSALRQGFTDADVLSLSDELVDSLVAWGSPEQIAERVRRQRAAGADHVYVSMLGDAGGTPAAAKLLAPLLFAD
jgi:probable F420-dependent oxidoreductase